MRSTFAVLFLAIIALTYSKNYEDIKEELKNEVENEILKDLEEDDNEFDDNVQENVNDARPLRRFFRRLRGRKLLQYLPAAIKVWSLGKKK
uniref:Arminin 01798 n=1 Tax=Hydra vulgaris TaxID=6087 RepID=R9UFK6_HYDVU|nr:arminin 01798 [Hydra vulgaris]